MTWNNLARDIATEMRDLEGCMPRGALAELYQVIEDPAVSQRNYRKTVGGKATQRKYKQSAAGKLANAKYDRTKPMRRAIQAWKTDAVVVMLGRDLPVSDWLEVLTNPVSAVEIEAFTDFCFFLRQCKRVSIPRISSMLETNEVAIRFALASRGVT